jgi:hypothetical protein
MKRVRIEIPNFQMRPNLLILQNGVQLKNVFK